MNNEEKGQAKETAEGVKGSTNYVIAIGGVSGAGKTALVDRVAEMLGEKAVTFYYDNYPFESPDDSYSWLKNGLDVNLIKTPQFAEDLRLLKSGKSVKPPMNREGKTCDGVVNPAPFIVVEEPFAGIRKEVTGLIDLGVQINIPMEIALGRKWLREFPSYASDLKEKSDFNYDNFMNFIITEMFFYLVSRRDEYLLWHNQAMENCDLIVDGMKSVYEMAGEVVEVVRAKSRLVIGDANTRKKLALTTTSSVSEALKSHPDAREIIDRHSGMPLDDSQLASVQHMTIRQVTLFLGWDSERTGALLRELNQD